MHRQRGFTLIELLVVISIIALLIGILLPALGTARDASKTALCGTRTKQLLTASAAYETDYRLMLPSYDYTMQPGFYNYWWGRSNTLGEMVGDDQNAGFLMNYIPRGSVDGCPALDRVDIQNHFGYVGYGYNWNHVPNQGNGYGRNLIAGNIKIARRSDDIMNPSSKAMFADSRRITIGTGVFTASAASGWMGTGSVARGVFASGISSADMFQGRHRGVGSVAWADGHVSTFTPAYYDTSTPSTATTAPNAGYSPANNQALLMPNFLGYIDSDGDPGTREHIVLTQ